MSSSNTLNDADLKSRLAHFGINQPITSTTRNLLLKKLLKLEMDFKKDQNNQSTRLDCESMVNIFLYKLIILKLLLCFKLLFNYYYTNLNIHRLNNLMTLCY